MSEFVFEYEKSPWELALDRLQSGQQISAVRLLTLLEGEEEYAWEEAFQTLEEKHIALNPKDLPTMLKEMME
jgi:hypothetical protein